MVKNFGNKPEDFRCNLGDRITFGENYSYMQHGEEYNNQDILLDGELIGLLHEHQPYSMLEPMEHTFMVLVDDEYEQHPNFVDDEYSWLMFPTLQMFCDFVIRHLDYLKKVEI